MSVGSKTDAVDKARQPSIRKNASISNVPQGINFQIKHEPIGITHSSHVTVTPHWHVI
jgi:hypothetical protein